MTYRSKREIARSMKTVQYSVNSTNTTNGTDTAATTDYLVNAGSGYIAYDGETAEQ